MTKAKVKKQMSKRNALTIRTNKKYALRVNRVAITHDNLVYIAKANKKIKYDRGDSKIAYIGQTANGIARIAGSAADKAKDILQRHGYKYLDFYVVTCKPRRKIKTWKYLERDLLNVFYSMYGELPIGNERGGKSRKNMSGYFREERLRDILDKYSA